MNTDPVTSHNNVKDLRQLYDVMESNARSLKSFRVTSRVIWQSSGIDPDEQAAQ